MFYFVFWYIFLVILTFNLAEDYYKNDYPDEYEYDDDYDNDFSTARYRNDSEDSDEDEEEESERSMRKRLGLFHDDPDEDEEEYGHVNPSEFKPFPSSQFFKSRYGSSSRSFTETSSDHSELGNALKSLSIRNPGNRVITFNNRQKLETTETDSDDDNDEDEEEEEDDDDDEFDEALVRELDRRLAEDEEYSKQMTNDALRYLNKP